MVEGEEYDSDELENIDVKDPRHQDMQHMMMAAPHKLKSQRSNEVAEYSREYD